MGGVLRKWLSMRYPWGRSVSDHGSGHVCTTQTGFKCVNRVFRGDRGAAVRRPPARITPLSLQFSWTREAIGGRGF
jgi:hypothetical protein